MGLDTMLFPKDFPGNIYLITNVDGLEPSFIGVTGIPGLDGLGFCRQAAQCNIKLRLPRLISAPLVLTP